LAPFLSAVTETTAISKARIEIAEPNRFTMKAVVAVNLFGLLLAIPVLVSVLYVSLLRFGFGTVLIPCLVVAVTVVFLPLGFGNPYVARLARSLQPASEEGEGFIVQLTLSPRIRAGLRAIMEDADDVGYLSVTADAIRFAGDSVRLCVPQSSIEEVQIQNIGLRGLYVYGGRVAVRVRGLPGVEVLEFAERCSWFLPGSWRISRRLQERFAKR
jgi:hypothetical protein